MNLRLKEAVTLMRKNQILISLLIMALAFSGLAFCENDAELKELAERLKVATDLEHCPNDGFHTCEYAIIDRLSKLEENFHSLTGKKVEIYDVISKGWRHDAFSLATFDNGNSVIPLDGYENYFTHSRFWKITYDESKKAYGVKQFPTMTIEKYIGKSDFPTDAFFDAIEFRADNLEKASIPILVYELLLGRNDGSRNFINTEEKLESLKTWIPEDIMAKLSLPVIWYDDPNQGEFVIQPADMGMESKLSGKGEFIFTGLWERDFGSTEYDGTDFIDIRYRQVVWTQVHIDRSGHIIYSSVPEILYSKLASKEKREQNDLDLTSFNRYLDQINEANAINDPLSRKGLSDWGKEMIKEIQNQTQSKETQP